MCPRRIIKAKTEIHGVVDRMLALKVKDLPKPAVKDLQVEFTKSNPKFFKLQAMGKWTGNVPSKIVGFEKDDGVLLLPRGAIATIDDILSGYGLTVSWRDDTVTANNDTKIKFNGKLRPYQTEAADLLTKSLTGTWPQYPNGVLRGPPGSGKTILACGVIARRDVMTLVVVHSAALMQQWREACARFLGFAPGTIQGKKVDVKPVTLAMQQTLARARNPSYASKFGLIVCDEIHHWGAPLFNRVAKMFPAAQRFGVSADNRRKDGLEFLIEWTFGPLLHEIFAEDLISIGRLLPIEMTVVPTGYVDEIYLDSLAMDSNPDWVGMQSRLAADMDRNAKIVNRARKVLLDDPDARILILAERVEHVEQLAAQLFMYDVKVGKMLGGVTNKKELERTKRGLQRGRISVGVGTKVADEGLDIPALTDVFLCCPVHQHPKRVQQMVGRAARPSKGKKVGRATYFWDRLMFPPYPEEDPARERGEKNLIKKLEKGVGAGGSVKVEETR